ncbi:hypothetical protein OIDMADRAFT_139835 [Oidiodendron maius Zn]|uniref:Uncharacterized protein n=1 Tax=Oidiodendron maius (strain Zn) TaxID=913774 RepID=A0A0C3HG96_OIDMZ|nr:hypothetical protein OIDMADRAFT_139835 [Oidiodendron maius Zn]
MQKPLPYQEGYLIPYIYSNLFEEEYQKMTLEEISLQTFQMRLIESLIAAYLDDNPSTPIFQLSRSAPAYNATKDNIEESNPYKEQEKVDTIKPDKEDKALDPGNKDEYNVFDLELENKHPPYKWFATVIETTAVTPKGCLTIILERRRDPAFNGPWEDRPFMHYYLPTINYRVATFKDHLAQMLESAPSTTDSSTLDLTANFKFRRAVVFTHHPQTLFYDTIGDLFVERQERSIAAAASMARVEHIPNYYLHKLWNKFGLSSHKRHEHMTLGHFGKVSLDIPADFQDNPDPTSTTSGHLAQHGNWEQFFNKNPHSNLTLIKLLPDAILAVTLPEIQNWLDPSTMPPPVLNWWKGQKQILFYNVRVSGLDNMLPVLENSNS